LPVGLILDQIHHFTIQVVGHTLDQGIAFGVYGGIVQRISGFANTQKTGALFKGLIAEPGDFFQFGPAFKGAVLRPVLHDILG